MDKKTLNTKIRRKILPSTPKIMQLWLEEITAKISSFFGDQHKSNKTELPVNLDHCQEVLLTAMDFEDELTRTLNGKPLVADYQQIITRLSDSLQCYQKFIAKTKGNLTDPDQYWNQLSDLAAIFGKSLLPLCNEEAGLRADKQQKEKHEQVNSIILVVEKWYHKITCLKKQVEKTLTIFGKSPKVPENTHNNESVNSFV